MRTPPPLGTLTAGQAVHWTSGLAENSSGSIVLETPGSPNEQQVKGMRNSLDLTWGNCSMIELYGNLGKVLNKIWKDLQGKCWRQGKWEL